MSYSRPLGSPSAHPPDPRDALTPSQRIMLRMAELQREQAAQQAAEDERNMRMLPNGKIVSGMGGGIFEEPDGTIVDTTPRPGDSRSQRHRAAVDRFRARAHAHAVSRARRCTHSKKPRTRIVRTREHRPAASRRASSSSRTSSADPPSTDGDPEPPPALPRRLARKGATR